MGTEPRLRPSEGLGKPRRRIPSHRGRRAPGRLPRGVRVVSAPPPAVGAPSVGMRTGVGEIMHQIVSSCGVLTVRRGRWATSWWRLTRACVRMREPGGGSRADWRSRERAVEPWPEPGSTISPRRRRNPLRATVVTEAARHVFGGDRDLDDGWPAARRRIAERDAGSRGRRGRCRRSGRSPLRSLPRGVSRGGGKNRQPAGSADQWPREQHHQESAPPSWRWRAASG